MPVTDLVESYIEFVLSRDEPDRYEQMRPELFAHYHEFWSKRRPYARDLEASSLRQKRDRVESHLRRLIGCFESQGLNAAQFEVILFVGHGTTNGHAMRDNGRVVIWIPVETYEDPLYTDVFLTHEIAHALHYFRAPAFYFETPEEKDRMSRMLITEGLATYLTSVVLGCTEAEALWAQYLVTEPLTAWMTQAEERFREVCLFLLQNFDRSFTNHGLFCLLDTSDVFRSRAGYFVGLRVVQAIARSQGLEPSSLLGFERSEFEQLTREYLASQSA